MDCHVPILLYHSVADDGPAELAPYRVSCAAFRRQVRYLREAGYHPISLHAWALNIATRRFVPGRPVVITFDDGYADFMPNAWPVLAAAQLFATIFVVTGRVGGTADWDKLEQRDGLPLMGWDNLRFLQNHGNSIASHCAQHRPLTRLADEQIAADCGEARAALRRELGSEVTALAYPWGKSDARVRRICGDNGYRIGVSIDPAISSLSSDPMNLPRIEIFASDDVDSFARKLAAAEPPPAEAAVSIGTGSEAATAGQAILPDGDPVDALLVRLDRASDELRSIREELATLRRPSASLQQRLPLLFAQSLTGPVAQLLNPRQELAPGIRVVFEPTARLTQAVMPKLDHSVSPASYLNVLRLGFSGSSRWFYLELTVAWGELSNARRFQLGLSARVSRATSCGAVLRLWQKDNQYIELDLAALHLEPHEQNYNLSGDLPLPDPLTIDHNSDPLFLLMFDTAAAVDLELSYFNLYFA